MHTRYVFLRSKMPPGTINDIQIIAVLRIVHCGV